MSLNDDIAGYVADALAAEGGPITAAGTVATSPSAVSTDPLTVVLDGSSVAVPVKMLRGFPIFPSMRVALLLVGSDWVVIGSLSNPGTGTGQQRMAVGADTPPELQAYGIGVAMLMYDTDAASGLEVGYFFIGVSNILDAPPQKVMLFGYVKYPTPGDPLSPTVSDVHTAHQVNLDGFTWFKDGGVRFLDSVPWMRFNSADVRVEQYAAGRPNPVWVFANAAVHLNPTELWVHGRLLQNNVRTIEADGNVTVTITGTTNTLLPNTAITDITKELSGTRMRVYITGTLYRSGTSYTRVHYGVRITNNNAGGALVGDYDVGRMGLSTQTDRRQVTGWKTLPAIPAGSYTVQIYARGTVSTNGNIDVGGAEDCWFLKWEEIS